MTTGELPQLIAIVGPTASGKSDFAIALAKKINGEIVSADSRQLYRGFVIGAGVVPGAIENRDGKDVWIANGIPHHLIGTVDPRQPYTLAEYKRAAESAIADILSRGKTPILCGGTGLYVSAVIDNFSMPEVAPDGVFRQAMEQQSTEALFHELQEKDLAYAARITPKNRRYIIRALEVMRATGSTVSALQRRGEPKYDAVIIGVAREKEELRTRINNRVAAQMAQGLVEEVRALSMHYGWEIPAMTGIGYREWRSFFEDKATQEDCQKDIIRNTIQFAKRQITWYKRDSRIVWVGGVDEALAQIRQK